MKYETTAIHAGQEPDPTTGAIMTPIFQTSTYVQTSPGVTKAGYDYARTANPTRTALEANLAALEGGTTGICFSSGCAAMTAAIHLLKSGDHVMLCDDVYGGTFRLFDKVFSQLGITYSLVDMTSVPSIESGFRAQTKLVWIETPTNPMLKIIDISEVASAAKKRGALTLVDNTFATSYLQRPFEYGADIVCHSSTKYIGGHSDVVGGVLIVKDAELGNRLHYLQNALGSIPAPLDCFLLLRSTKTLAVRMERHCVNAERLAQYLSAHRACERVFYPGLESHPQHQIAKRQMMRYGGMISVVLRGDLAVARRFLERVRVFSLGESLGGVESLIEHPAIMTHATVPADHRQKLGIVDGLVRISVGIEHIDDLIGDIEQALR